jgi:hypothetical protein
MLVSARAKTRLVTTASSRFLFVYLRILLEERQARKMLIDAAGAARARVGLVMRRPMRPLPALYSGEKVARMLKSN